MKRILFSIMVTVMVVALMVGAVFDLMDVDPLAAPEPDAAAVLAQDLAPVGETPFMLALAEEAVAPDAIADTTLYIVIIGTSALGLTLILTTAVMRGFWSRSSSRTGLFSGWVRFPLKHPTAA